MPVIDDILDHTIRAVASARTHMDQGTSPLSDSFDPFGDVNRTTLHGQGSPVGDPGFESVFGFQDNPVYTLDVFNDTPTGRPWWYDHTTPASAAAPDGSVSQPMPGFEVAAWMKDNSHGNAPYSALVAIGPNNRPSTNGKWYLRPDVAAAWSAMDQAFFQKHQEHLTKYVVSAFRNFTTPYETSRGMQWRDSDHASGGAIDVNPNSPAETFILEHGPEFGFGREGAGRNWGDPGHHSFTAGGFNGWMTSYSGPQEADKRWIALAAGKGGDGGATLPPRQAPMETFPRTPPTIPLERLQALVPAAQQMSPGPVPEYQTALPMALTGLFTPDTFSGGVGNIPKRRGAAPTFDDTTGLGRRLDGLHFGSAQGRFKKIKDYFLEAARATGIDPKVLAFVGLHESSFNPTVCSSAGYCGIMQIKGSTHGNWRDPKYNIMEGARELKGWMKLAQSRGLDPLRYGLAYYNVGGYASQSAINAALTRYVDPILEGVRAA